MPSSSVIGPLAPIPKLEPSIKDVALCVDRPGCRLAVVRREHRKLLPESRGGDYFGASRHELGRRLGGAATLAMLAGRAEALEESSQRLLEAAQEEPNLQLAGKMRIRAGREQANAVLIRAWLASVDDLFLVRGWYAQDLERAKLSPPRPRWPRYAHPGLDHVRVRVSPNAQVARSGEIGLAQIALGANDAEVRTNRGGDVAAFVMSQHAELYQRLGGVRWQERVAYADVRHGDVFWGGESELSPYDLELLLEQTLLELQADWVALFPTA